MSQSVSGDPPIDLDQLQAEPYVALPEDVPRLVAEVRALRQENEQLKAELRGEQP